MDFILVSTENHDDAYFASARELTDAVLQRAIDQLGENRGFSCLPAVSLTALSPPTAAVSGAAIGALTVFRGGRMGARKPGEPGAGLARPSRLYRYLVSASSPAIAAVWRRAGH
jgi:hypothetical protein